MGRIGYVIEVLPNTDDGEDIPDVKIETQGGNTITAPAFAPAGVEAPPLPGDYAVTTSVPGDTREVVVAYADDVNASVAANGEFYAAARNPSTKARVVWIRLYTDGRARIENGDGYIELEANGLVNINGNLTVDP